MTHDVLEQQLRELAAAQPNDDELRRRIRAELHTPAPARQRRLRWPVVAAVAAATAAAVVALVGTSGPGAPSTADAAVLHRTLAAVTPSGGTILHVKLLDTSGRFVFESWQQSDAPYAYRLHKGPVGATGDEAQDATTNYTYDPSSNTIFEQPASPNAHLSDPVTTIRDELANGQAHVEGTATIDGQELYKIELDGGLIAYVDKTTEIPRYLDDPQHDGDMLRFKVTAYERLDATTANLRLLSVVAQHPDAQITASASPGQKTGDPTTTTGPGK